ncbi:hypothetical protein K491DRAFT_723503 [Lophiostoma macrostomum CBS 122681]|uniref:Uncharacterized protein n=1 Tax=Lophiostoma macrostomum CBS 122681 TaxID=1314788 RepID=A0A6A6SL46_9PLEO|nr:hypothetical protein K491DRAFT_723503 [Lophiostoma macrostomum CBS 122681]
MSRSPELHYDEIAFTEHEPIAMAGSYPTYSDEQYQDAIYIQPFTSPQTDCGHQMAYDPDSEPHETKHTLHDECEEKRIGDRRRIYWLPPTMMCLSLFLGVGLAVGHHVYYSWLNGQDVGSVESNAFAISLALCFKTAVGIAYVQYFWKTLHHESLSLKAINDGFDINSNILPFFSWELVSRMWTGLLLALVLWCLPLSSLFAPATLSVKQTLRTTYSQELVLRMNISTLESANNFVYRSSVTPIIKEGPVPIVPVATSRVTRIVAAVAYTGQRLTFDLPPSLVNSSYRLEANVPSVKCTEDKTNQTRSALLNIPRTQYVWVTTNDTFSWFSHEGDEGPAGQFGYIAAMNGLNWNTTEDNLGLSLSIGILRPRETFLNCKLLNSTVSFTVQTQGGVGNIAEIETKSLPDSETCAGEDWSAQAHFPCVSYLTFFHELSLQFLGFLSSRYNDTDSITDDWSQGTATGTNLALGSQWLDMAKDISTSFQPSPGKVRNVTFAEDIENFALNASLSLLNDPSLCETVLANVTSTTSATVYNYQPSKLFIAYGLSISLSTLAVLFGVNAIIMNGVSYDTKPTTFGIAMRRGKVQEAFENASAAQPLERSVGKIKVRFDPLNGFVPRPQSREVAEDWNVQQADEEMVFNSKRGET